MDTFSVHSTHSGDKVLSFSVKDFSELLTKVSMAAIAKYESVKAPRSDRMKQGEAKQYLISRGCQATLLKEWVEKGMVSVTRYSDAPNAAAWYSRAEIENIITSMGIEKAMIEAMI